MRMHVTGYRGGERHAARYAGRPLAKAFAGFLALIMVALPCIFVWCGSVEEPTVPLFFFCGFYCFPFSSQKLRCAGCMPYLTPNYLGPRSPPVRWLLCAIFIRVESNHDAFCFVGIPGTWCTIWCTDRQKPDTW